MKATVGGAMSAGPSTEITRNFPLDDDDVAMAVDSLVVVDNIVFPDEALLSLIEFLAKKLRRWNDNGTDAAINDVLQTVFVCLSCQVQGEQGCPPSFLAYEGQIADQTQFLNNVKVAKERDPNFFKSLGEAIRGQNKELWRCVLMHGMSPDLRWAGLSVAHSEF